MGAAAPSEPDRPYLRVVTPAWHTVVVLLALFTLSALQSLSPFGRAYGRPVTYLIVLALEWLLTAFIWVGVRSRGIQLRELLGRSWPDARSMLRDLGIAALFLLASNVILAFLGRLLGAVPGPGVREILPNGRTEVVLYLLLALTAGVCEEIIFRGFLQRQFAALTRSTAAGLLLQGIAFGAAHGYQGRKFMLIIAVYGCLFGLLAFWRKNLRPGMIAHFLQDGVAGLVASHFLK